uniref:Holin n=1 Tax=viral metagenome TaxID=1070528 RepID=A0A6M3LXD4_9ZZZZ
MAKKFYTSKTLWVNLIALVAIILQLATGKEAFNLEAQASLLAVINLVLRLVTKKPVGW